METINKQVADDVSNAFRDLSDLNDIHMTCFGCQSQTCNSHQGSGKVANRVSACLDRKKSGHLPSSSCARTHETLADQKAHAARIVVLLCVMQWQDIATACFGSEDSELDTCEQKKSGRNPTRSLLRPFSEAFRQHLWEGPVLI